MKNSNGIEMVAGRKHSILAVMNGITQTLTIEYRSDDEIEKEYACPLCNASIMYRHKYCHDCGSKIAWKQIEIDPREKIICNFCGRNIISQPAMVEGGKGRICADCILDSYSKIKIERILNPHLISLDDDL